MTWILALEPLFTTVLANSTSYQNQGGWIATFFMLLVFLFELLFTGVFFLIWIAFAVIAVLATVVIVISSWKIFVKAGKPGWAALIPYYNTYVLSEICFGNGIYFLLLLAGFLPGIGSAVMMAFMCYQSYMLGRVFNKSTGFTLGLIFLPVIFMPLLAFKENEYHPENANFLKFD